MVSSEITNLWFLHETKLTSGNARVVRGGPRLLKMDGKRDLILICNGVKLCGGDYNKLWKLFKKLYFGN